MDRVELELREIGRAIRWPETPEFATRVQAAIRAEQRVARPAPPQRIVWRLRPAVALALALILALATTAAIPSARSAVLRWLGITGVSVQPVKHLPHARADAALGLGDPVSFAAAHHAAPFAIRVPGTLGDPDRVLLRGAGSETAVTLVYRPRAGLPALPGRPRLGALLTEFRGTSTEFIGKMVPEASRVTRSDVGNSRGYWLENPHVVVIQYTGGRLIDQEFLRLVRGHVLIWERGAVSLRLETNLTRRRALTLARSIR